MSNPAVIELKRGEIGRSLIYFDDNFGESIHMHIDDMRIEMATTEFRQLYEDLCESINRIINIPEFDVKNIDPVFLSMELWRRLGKLTKVTIDRVKLADLYAPYGVKFYKLEDSVGVNYLRGKNISDYSGETPAYHCGQQENERMEEILDSIKNKGYPFDNNYIILYGNELIIKDGQHRAACLYYLKGNVEIPVMRLFFKGYKEREIRWYTNLFIICWARVIKRKMYKIIKHILMLMKKMFYKFA